ncbi:hypothetical protein NDU88_006346 [Pleurodeles waltl]|uniref:Uncharacterized protein n=1 Tax=Pleurodeles waltl TaxID=8319 RepID=A0AAV7WG13_PLEWA|nr:hypothetical protein NDU88_006346 [Pleurodeles waltl]
MAVDESSAWGPPRYLEGAASACTGRGAAAPAGPRVAGGGGWAGSLDRWLCWWLAGPWPAAGDDGGPGLRALEEAVSGAHGNSGAAGGRTAERGLGLRPIVGGDSGLHCLRSPRGVVGAAGVAWPPRDVVSGRGLADMHR